jgi:hypothetical protein
MKPYLSIVIAARNDNYGGNLLNRISTMIRTATYLLFKYSIDSEIILVEYNPPSDRPSLSGIIRSYANSIVKIRVITVTPEFHLKFKNHKKIPLFEFIAKNIGIRRAKGKFILATNQDIIFSSELISFISHKKLQSDSYYRVNRYDSYRNYYPEDMPVKELITDAKNTSYCAWTNKGKVYLNNHLIRYREQLKDIIFAISSHFSNIINDHKNIKLPLKKYHLHEAAAGDFLLMSTANWQKIKGYDETPLSNFLDGYALYVASGLGIKEKILPFPIYHIRHQVAKSNRPSFEYLEYVKKTVLITNKVYNFKINNPNWGHPKTNFPEVVYP